MTVQSSLARPDTPPVPAPGDLVIDPATIPENRRHLVPRFADPVWPITFTSGNPSVAEVRLHWATFPAGLREQFRLAAWALLNFPVPDRVLARRGAAMRSRLSTLRLYHTVTNWRTFATWLDGRGITELAQVSTQVLTDYSIYLARTRKVSRNTAINHLVALTRLHVYAPRLPAELRIGVPAWESEGLDDYLPAATATGENATEPISPATMGPLLVWALKFVEEFAADILAAHAEEHRLRQIIDRHLAQPFPHGPRPPALAAWHIARRPGGLVALAVQYGHLRTLVSQGYSSRQRDGIHQLLDLETARAVAEHLSEVHDALHHGEGVSGPAARRLIHAAREEHHRFGGILTTPRQAKALLSDPALTVFENADAYLICNYDPSRALCNPNNATDSLASTPSLDRCQATCPNIARTDSHAQQLRALAERLRDQAGAALTPQPVADRLRHRAIALIELADKHNRTRIALTDEESA